MWQNGMLIVISNIKSQHYHNKRQNTTVCGFITVTEMQYDQLTACISRCGSVDGKGEGIHMFAQPASSLTLGAAGKQ